MTEQNTPVLCRLAIIPILILLTKLWNIKTIKWKLSCNCVNVNHTNLSSILKNKFDFSTYFPQILCCCVPCTSINQRRIVNHVNRARAIVAGQPGRICYCHCQLAHMSVPLSDRLINIILMILWQHFLTITQVILFNTFCSNNC